MSSTTLLDLLEPPHSSFSLHHPSGEGRFESLLDDFETLDFLLEVVCKGKEKSLERCLVSAIHVPDHSLGCSGYADL